MRLAFALGQIGCLQWAGLVASAGLAVWVCLRLNSMASLRLPTSGAAQPSAWALALCALALHVPVFVLFWTARMHGNDTAGLLDTASQVRWSVYAGTLSLGWVAWVGAATRGAAERAWDNERLAWGLLIGPLWAFGAGTRGVWGFFLVLELALLLLLALIFFTHLAQPVIRRRSTFRAQGQQLAADRALTWVFLLLLWASALSLLLLVWAWALLASCGMASDVTWQAGLAQHTRRSLPTTTAAAVFAQGLAGLALLVKMLLVPAQFTLTRLYLCLSPEGFAVYLWAYYLLFFPLSVVVLLGSLPALLAGWALKLPLALLLGLLTFARMVYPVRDLRALLAFSTVTTFLLLLIAVCL